MTDSLPKVYLAGPDVFSADRALKFERLRSLCLAHGLEPVEPADAPALGEVDGKGQARIIFDENIARIRQADAVLANASPFRGPEPDSGTMFEVGFACALGKPVVLYTVARVDWGSQLAAAFGEQRANGERRDARFGELIEDFGLRLNLMLACSCPIEDSPSEAVLKLKRLLEKKQR